MTADLLEYQDQLVVVPRLCDWCERHPAVFFWAGSWPLGWMCRLCVDGVLPALERQPWVRPIGFYTAEKEWPTAAPLASHVGPLASETLLPPTSTF